MKNTTPDAAILQELGKLTRRMLELCTENNIPVVIGYSYIKNSDENNCTHRRHTSAYINEKAGAYDPSIAAAANMLKIKDVPRSVIFMLDAIAQDSDQEQGIFDAGERVH
ncbi:hypothetical protein ACEY8Q_17230 [Salmonella enterica subsp. enterica]|uniref:hypothetical protein n=1 Tax=Salmonella enterica TaxID=28901 RepID=UPI0035B5D3DC